MLIIAALVCMLHNMQAFQAMAKGDKHAMAKYNEQQVKQLTRLIEVTRTDLAKVGRKRASADSSN